MKNWIGLVTAITMATITPLHAQQAPAAPAAPRARATTTPEPPPPPPPPPVGGQATRRNAQPVNVQIEFTLTEQREGNAPLKRTVNLIVADAHSGQIRSANDLMSNGQIPLNIDVTPELLPDGKVRVGFTLQYDWSPVQGETVPARGSVVRTSLRESLTLVLESGKQMTAAQSADPVGDRRTTVEVKATILK